MTRICLVACYFGSWPKYVDLFLGSCRRNPSVDFLLFSDCGPLSDAPPNVQVVPMELEEVRDRIRQKLGVKPSITSPYGMCDFKPTYGVLFDDYLYEYEFWGCTDLDLIYGDIRSLVTDDLLAENDIVAAKKYYLTGFFFLFRNEERVNHLYRKSRDAKRVLESTRHFSFTECNHQWDALIKGASISDLDTDIESMTEVIRREEQAGRIRTHFSNLSREIMTGDPYTWEEGILYEGEKERLLLHFVLLKNRYYFTFPDWDEVPSRFHVLPTGFYRDGEHEGWNHLRALPAETIARRWWQQTSEKVKRKLSWR